MQVSLWSLESMSLLVKELVIAACSLHPFFLDWNTTGEYGKKIVTACSRWLLFPSLREDIIEKQNSPNVKTEQCTKTV